MFDDEISGYIGWFKQPIEKPRTCKPTMYMVSDSLKKEMDLVLLTPGCFLEAYHHIKNFGAIRTRLFIPSLRYEWISDIFNLYMTMRDIWDVKWVFPKRSDHDDFEKGHIVRLTHVNRFDSRCGIRYIENVNMDGVYDIEIMDHDGIHYFSQYLDEETLKCLIDDTRITDIHLPYRSTIYGGLSYYKVFESDQKNARSKLIPHSFLSLTDYHTFHDMKNVNKGKVINYDLI